MTSNTVNVLVLASGSSGNSLIVRTGDHSLMVDAGISPRTVQARCRTLGLPLTSLDAVLVTHWHQDHARYAVEVANQYACPVIGSSSTVNHFDPKPPRTVTLPALPVGPFQITSTSVPHEEGSRAFLIETGGKKVLVAHDLGEPTEALLFLARQAHCLCIESNYDPEMLEKADTGRYTPEMKSRIRSDDRGHLSNAQAAEVVRACSPDTLQAVVALHLSSRCNSPILCQEALSAALEGYSADLRVARQDEPIIVELAGEPAPELSADAQKAQAFNAEVDMLITEEKIANESAQRRRTRLGRLFAEMKDLFLSNDPESLGLRTSEGELCRHWEMWKCDKAKALGISRRTANLYLDLAENLLPLVPDEEVEQMSIVGADALALYASVKGEVTPELVEKAKTLPGHEMKEEVFKRLYPGTTGHFDGPETHMVLTAGKKQIKSIEDHLAMIKSLMGNEAGVSDAEIIEHALAEFFQSHSVARIQEAEIDTTPPDVLDILEVRE